MRLSLHCHVSCSLVNLLHWKSILICLLSLVATGHSFASTFSVTSYGAACNSNANTGGGTDDTAAFTSAAAAAHAAYVTNGSPQIVVLPAGSPCRINSAVGGTAGIGSGVVFEGPGTIVVPTQSGATLSFFDADNSGVENLTLKILSGPGGNNAALSAISWQSSSGDASAHTNFFARSNHIIDGSWGILVAYSAGTGSLSNVDITGNTVASSIVYTNADGIHVAGSVSGITINGNRVSNRGDAAIALSSELGSPSYVLSGAVVSNNVCINDLVGLDNSGATNATWSNNYVSATLSTSSSNPAARSILYGGVVPVNVKFIGNYLANYQNIDYAAKVDNTGSNVAANVEWIGNTFNAPNALYIAGNSIAVHDNIFPNGSLLSVAYDTITNCCYTTQNVMIGFNYWLGSGTISSQGNPAYYSNNSLAHQQANGIVTVSGQSNFRQP